MFQLDDKFLQDLGLDTLPDNQKQAFLEQVYASLEERVGVQLSEGLSDEQLEEFEAIIDRKNDRVDAWLAAHVPNFATDPAFMQLQQMSNLPQNDPGLKAEFTATKWLEINRPNYREVVAKTMEELKKEITQNRDAILASVQQQQQ
jgi:hypothetical protein